MKKLLVLLAVTSIALVGFSSIAGATIFFQLGLGNAALSGYPTPFGFVAVTRTSATTAVIEFAANNTGGYQYLFGDGGSVVVNVNASSWTLSLLAGSNSGTGFTPGPYSDGGGGNEDGFGSFNQRIDSFDGFTHSSSQIQFDLTNTSGTWASDSDVLTGNSQGFHVAAHIFVTSSPANAANGALATGFATEGGNTVPEPTSMLLLGLGLAGVGAARRRRKS